MEREELEKLKELRALCCKCSEDSKFINESGIKVIDMNKLRNLLKENGIFKEIFDKLNLFIL